MIKIREGRENREIAVYAVASYVTLRYVSKLLVCSFKVRGYFSDIERDRERNNTTTPSYL